MTSRRWPLRRTAIAWLCCLVWAAVPSAVAWAADESSGTYEDVEKQVRALRMAPVEGKIRGTYSTRHLFDTYSAGIQHVQGIAWFPGGWFALTHNSRSDRKALFVSQKSGESDTVMLTIGSGGDHPGAFQAAGKVAAIAIKGESVTEVVFMDLRKRDDPRPLDHLRIASPSGAEAVGFAYDPKRKVHWVLTTNANYAYGFTTATLYKSNGKSLFDSGCRFSASAILSNLFASQGGTQILFDPEGKMYVAALYRVEPDGEKDLDRTSDAALATTSGGFEHVALSAIGGLDGRTPTVDLLVDQKLSDSGEWSDYDAGFRWGGTIAQGSDGKLQAVGISRTLAYGPAQPYAVTRTWSTTRSASAAATCAAGQEMSGGLCYTPCRAGYKAVVTMCVKTGCPTGFRDDELYCAKPAPYGRGAGYPWKLGDDVGSLDDARARCRAANPQGCEKEGQIIYPKCRAGFRAMGSNVCSPECPSGFTDIGVSCKKDAYDRGAGVAP